MAANPQLVIRIAADTAELRRNILEGRAVIEALGPSVAKLQSQWSKHSQALVQDARNITAAVQTVGAATLTAGDSARALKTLEAAMLQLRTAGQPIPPLMAQTAAELHKLHPAATQAGSALTSVKSLLGTLGVGVGIGAAVAGIKTFASSVMQAADNLVGLRSRTAISIEGLQVLGAVARGGGTDLESLAGVINIMQDRLAGGDKSAVTAVKALGINFAALRAMAPDEQFYAVSKAVVAVDDAALRAKLRVDLMGKGANQVADAMVQDFEKIRRETVTMSGQTVEAIEAAGDRLDAWLANVKVHTVNMLVPTFAAITRLVDYVELAIDRAVMAAASSVSVILGLMTKIPGVGSAAAFGAGAASGVAVAFKIASDELITKMQGQDLAALFPKATAGGKGSGGGGEWPDAGLKKAEKSWQNYWDTVKVYSDDATRWMQQDLNAWVAYTKRSATTAQQAMAGAFNASVAMLSVPASTSILTRYSALIAEIQQRGSGSLVVWQNQAATFGEKMMSLGGTIASVFSNINSTIGQSAQIVGHALEQMWAKGAGTAQKMVAGFSALSALLSQYAGEAPGKGMMAAMGAATGAAAGAGIGAMMSGPAAPIGAAIGALAGALFGWTMAVKKAREANVAATEAIKDYQVELIKTYGSLENIKTLGAIVGVDLAGAWGDQSQAGLKHFKGLLDEFKAKLDTVREAMEKYGLSWLDLGEDMKRMTFQQEQMGLLTEYSLLTNAGVSPDKAIGGMSGALSQLVINAVDSGQKIDASLQPMLVSMIQMGKLTDEAARKLLGMADDAMPSLQEITEAAGRYGLNLDDLGSKVQQLRINETAAQIAKDFATLTEAEVPVGVLLEKMGGQVQELVNKSITLGLELPASMKPVVEAMATAGTLTDDTGQKLTDLSKLTFADDLSQMFDQLMLGLQDLITTIKGGLVPALGDIGNTKIPPVNIPYTWEQIEHPDLADLRAGGLAEPWVTMHGGGLIGDYQRSLALAARLPRAHGGLALDEVPFVGLTGERVLSREQTRAWDRGDRGGGGTPVQIVVKTYLNGREIAESVVPEIPGIVRRYGLS